MVYAATAGPQTWTKVGCRIGNLSAVRSFQSKGLQVTLSKSSRVLVVDDFELGRVKLIQVLNALGFTTIEQATTGKEAWTLMQDAATRGAPFELIFSDWQMPEMTGIELLNMCRADSTYREVTFVIVSAESDQEQTLGAINAGCDDYITKPFTLEKAGARIQKLLQRAKRK